MRSILGLPLTGAVLMLAGSAVGDGTHDAAAPELSPRHHPRDVRLQRRDQCGAGVGSCSNGECCSKYGWCGSTDGHCGTGCQPLFGPCTTEGGEGGSGGGDGGNGGGGGGGGILDVPRPKFGSIPYRTQITTCSEPGTIAITFDDGPYLYTAKLLDILAKYDAKSTFFINGRNWGNSRDAPYPDILRRMIADGHQIASHTDNHLDLNAIDSAARRQQMAGVEELTRDLFGHFPTYMRPPFGRCNAACQADMASLGYHVIMWNIDTLDYENDTPETIQNSLDIFDREVAVNATGKYISLEHDVHQTTVDVLAEHVVKTALRRGYRVVTVGECLGDPVGNWYRNATTGEPVSGDGNGGNPGQPGGGEPGGGEPTLEVSPDGTCADTSGGKYTCLGSWAGDCCSEWGWCGRSSGHCGTGCQAGFGKCD